MRVVVAPDKFAGSLSGPQAAETIARGWLRERPQDDCDCVPMADGGPGFLDCLGVALAGRRIRVRALDPLRRPVAAEVLLVADDPVATAYVESALADGLHLVAPQERDPERATTYGVGQLIDAAVAAGATRIVVGLGGSATNDGGAGMLAALGARAWDAAGNDAGAGLAQGPAGIAAVARVDLGPALERMRGIDLVLATDVDNPLLGPTGASHGFGRQKGAAAAAADRLESTMRHWRHLCETAGLAASVANAPGSGAAGGLGYGLLALGGRVTPGTDVVMRAVRLAERCATADVVVTGEGKFDWQSLHGKVVSGVLSACRPGAPVIVLCGQNEVPEAEWRPLGIAAVRTLTERAGSVSAAITGAGSLLADEAASAASVVADLVRPEPGPRGGSAP